MLTHRTHHIAYTVALVLAFSAAALLPVQIQAQNETTSPSAELREIIRQRIEETIQETSQEGPEFIGTLGTVSSVSTNTFTITDTLGFERTIQPSASSTLLVEDEPAELSDISIGNGAVIMGAALDEVIIEAERMLIQEDDFTESREVILGSVDEKSTTSLSVTSRGTGETSEIALQRSTEYEDSLGTAITLADIEENQSVLIITDVDEGDDEKDRYATRVRLLVPVESVETDE